jgi:transcriptional regulator with XRE-family HTH domain
MNHSDEILVRIGSNVRRIRTKKGLSLRELSYLCNIDNSKIAKIEQGRINITVKTLMELCSGLEVGPSELLRPVKVK